MKQIQTTILKHSYLQPYIAMVLISGCVVLLGMYAIFLSKTLLQTAEIKGLTVEIQKLSSAQSGLENSFLALKSDITLEKATVLGYVEVENPKYISRRTLGQGISFNNEL